MSKVYSLFIVLLLFSSTFPQSYHVIESQPDHIIIDFNFSQGYKIVDTVISARTFQLVTEDGFSSRKAGEPWLPEYNVNIGIPFGSNPQVTILENITTDYSNKLIPPFPELDPEINEYLADKMDIEIYNSNNFFPDSPAKLDSSFTVRYAKIITLDISPFQYQPVSRQLRKNNYLRIRIDYNSQGGSAENIKDGFTEDYLRSSVLNYDQAVQWLGKPLSPQSPALGESYWYDPNKEWFKIYVKTKGIYRVTYEELIASGAQLGNNTESNKLELFCNGELVPIDVYDSGDQIFNQGDYFQFVGFPPDPSPNVTMNIYNLSNVYWFSYQSDSTGLNYQKMNGFHANSNRSYISSLTTIHFERDTIYERLGYVPRNEEGDHWFWGKASAFNGVSTLKFEHSFDVFPNMYVDSHYVNLKVNMHGISNSSYCSTDHNAYISITDRLVGNIFWDGQRPKTFNKRFYVSDDSIKIVPVGNKLQVEVRGDSCPNDEIRINWAEFDYWRLNRAYGEYYNFTNYDFAGMNLYKIWLWESNDMIVYIPQKKRMLINNYFFNDTLHTVAFTDTLSGETEYFCASPEHFSTVDSIVGDASSNLRDLANGSDYIIIYHSDFTGLAEMFGNFRSNNFPDSTIQNPRIKIVDVNQVYDEFSYGLLDPYALQNFVKYAFEQWQAPAPFYIVLMGDMSYDYREILPDSRKNFIPSIPFFASIYGQAASDNLIVTVAGNDLKPDLSIGRLSMESVVEGNILINKLLNYPDDDSKPWKQNVLVVASGLDLDDELAFRFNDASLELCYNYVSPQGFSCSKVFRYPSKPEHEPFQGEGPKIREEINKGAALLNYYGHGAGSQWDLVFTIDDIYLLENGGRLPVIFSVTCYTAHFDNQDVFGEQFNSVEGKGSIGFFGSSGLTYWNVGKDINNKIFGEIFDERNYIIGKAIFNGKNQVSGGGIYGEQVSLLTYLGDPVMRLALPNYPDFSITSSDISLIPESPVVGDTILAKINIMNWGTVFPGDSVVVELFAESSDTAYQVGTSKLPSFGERDSVYFQWVPNSGGLYELTAQINETEMIIEEDHSDNIASELFVIFDISQPNTLKPSDGFVTTTNKVEFLFSDIGHYLHRDLEYYIEIDTAMNFTPPLFASGKLIPSGALLEWETPNLLPRVYFWRARIFDGSSFGDWGEVRSFSVMSSNENGYYAHDKILNTFKTYNINYSEETKSLSLNIDPLPPRVSNKTFIEDIFIDPELPDTITLSAITTDGTYLYFGYLSYWEQQNGGDGKSRIYRVGTGNNGTIKGHFYGPFTEFYDKINNTLAYHSDGFLYIPTGNPYQITRIDISTEQIDTADIQTGLLAWDRSLPVQGGGVYLNSNGEYVYNLTVVDTAGNQKYTVRTFDPENNWALARPDLVLDGSSVPNFGGFYVHEDYIYTVEVLFQNFTRMHRLSDGFFVEEWRPISDFQKYYAWCWDWTNDHIYASTYSTFLSYETKFSKFAGYYVDAEGTIESPKIGLAAWWNNLEYNLDNPGTTGESRADLLGLNNTSKQWDTLLVNIPASLPLNSIDSSKYSFLKVNFTLTDSSFGTSVPMEFYSLNIDYQVPSEIYFVRDDLVIEPDTILQGLPVTMSFIGRNVGPLDMDEIKLNFYLNGLDSLFHSVTVDIPNDSTSEEITYVIETDRMLFDNEIKVFAETNKTEYFKFNNLIDNQFFVARDSIRPLFSVIFDGKEIINEDIVSSNPEVVITLEDNSPLLLDTTFFTIVHNNIPLRFADPDLNIEIIGYPNSKATITWTPELEDGRHTLEILAKDASGNFFDSTSFRIIFNVFSETELREVYNYPNPFKTQTHFTFELRGTLPDEFLIKVYTIAGRLIRDISLPPSRLQIGFNKILWDGRDQDGDELGNGVYFYKVIAKFPDKTQVKTQKLAKVK